ncbi:MAG: SpoVA/SpoVAEb family sporulation membrane protein [Eggerthellaceae bacterium]|nr:SpoVA/SpoVAEb family sporulation membrane protein [Eggerthellaceae bacterium]
MKKLFNAFMIGGAFSVIGQLFIFAWAALLGPNNSLVNPLTMVTMGVLGLLLFVSGMAQKLEKLTTMGVTIPISGMVIAIGGVTAGVRHETENVGAAAKAGAGLPLRVLGTGAALSVALSALLWFTTHGSLELTFDAVTLAPLVDIVLAFIVGGIIALVAEAVLLVTKAPVPLLLIAFIVVGALLAAFNLDAAPILNNGGFIVSLLAAGQAAYETFEVLLMGVSPIPFVTVLCVYLSVTVLGIVAGLLKKK